MKKIKKKLAKAILYITFWIGCTSFIIFGFMQNTIY